MTTKTIRRKKMATPKQLPADKISYSYIADTEIIMAPIPGYKRKPIVREW